MPKTKNRSKSPPFRSISPPRSGGKNSRSRSPPTRLLSSHLRKGPPEFGADAKELFKFTEIQLSKLLVLAVIAYLQYRPRHSGVFLSKWLRLTSAATAASEKANVGKRTVTAEIPAVAKSKSVATLLNLSTSSEHAGSLDEDPIAKILGPTAQELDLVATDSAIAEMIATLNCNVKPILQQAVKAAIRARSEDMVNFIIHYLENANDELREMKVNDETLKCVERDTLRRSAAMHSGLDFSMTEEEKRGASFASSSAASYRWKVQEETQIAGAPTMSPLMKLSILLEQTLAGIEITMTAGRNTFLMVSEQRPPGVGAEDKVVRTAVRDVAGLSETLHLTAEGFLRAIEKSKQAMMDFTEDVRMQYGCIPLLEQEEIKNAVDTVCKEIQGSMDEMRNIVISHSESFLKAGDFKLQDYLEHTRSAVNQKLNEFEAEVTTDMDDLHKDIESQLDKSRLLMTDALKNPNLRAGDLSEIRRLMWRMSSGFEFICSDAETKLRAKTKRTGRAVQRVPLFGSLALVHVFLDSYCMSHLNRAHCPPHAMQEISKSNGGMISKLQDMLMTLIHIVEKRTAEEDVLEGMEMEKVLLGIFVELVRHMRNWQDAIMADLRGEEAVLMRSTTMSKLRKLRAEVHIDPQRTIDKFMPPIEQTLTSLHACVKTTVRLGGPRKTALLSTMIHVKRCVDLLQTICEDVVDARFAACAPSIQLSPHMEEIHCTYRTTKTVIKKSVLAIGRLMPDWHEMYVTEAQLLEANKSNVEKGTLAKTRKKSAAKSKKKKKMAKEDEEKSARFKPRKT